MIIPLLGNLGSNKEYKVATNEITDMVSKPLLVQDTYMVPKPFRKCLFKPSLNILFPFCQ
jgi:hypothetical protein